MRLGIVGVIEGGPFPEFPKSPLERIRWAFAAPLERTTDKVVLTILATYANDKGVAWPGLATIAQCGSMTRRTAINAVGRLVKAGWLAIEKRPHRTSQYWPKSPGVNLCSGCKYVVPARVSVCGICGTETHELVQYFHLGVN